MTYRPTIFSKRKARLCQTGAIIAAILMPGLATAQSLPQASSGDPLAGVVGRDVSTTHRPVWPSEPTAPRGAPNVLIIMTDDVGFGVSGTFGGPIPTPTLEALAQQGARYTSFNTTALCSPTRASLLTGRLPQNVNVGNVTNMPTGYDGYTSVIPKSAGTLPKILKENGYNTAMFGKSHLTPEWEMSMAGPFDRWPTGLGFEYFYGFLGGDTSLWEPSLVENTLAVEPPHGNPAYHFEADIADRAIAWLRGQHAAAPGKPFFLYYAPASAHAPHQAPKEWLDRFRGQFDQGWDKVREETFARQKALGIVPADARISPRPSSLPAWSSLNAAQRKVYARSMEAFAALVAYSDAQTGRVIEELRRSGQLNNTLIFFIEGDNGSSAEGGLNGLAYEQSMSTGRKEEFAELAGHYADIGGPRLFNHFPAAWAWAMNAPFPWWKQIASQAGGVRNGMVVSWPGRIVNARTIRTQYAHVSDIMPTILEATGVTAPETLDGVEQKPIDGISLAYSFTQPSAPSQRRTQIYEMMENFGIYKDGWMAGTLPKRAAWDVGAAADRRTDIGPEGRTWTLFNLNSDFTTSNDLAKSQPGRLKELQDLFWDEARKNNILPIHDYSQGDEGRPSLGASRSRFVYPPGVSRVPEDAAPHTIGRSFSIAADVTIPPDGANGVMIADGGRFGGYAFYLKDGKPVFHYNAVGKDQYTIASGTVVTPGKHRLTAVFSADQPRPRTAGTVTLLIDNEPVATGKVEQTVAGWLSISEGLDIGRDTITPVSPDYTVATRVQTQSAS